MKKIRYKCPSCNNETLMIDASGWLVCSWLKCEEPDAFHKRLESSHNGLTDGDIYKIIDEHYGETLSDSGMEKLASAIFHALTPTPKL